jgi:flagellar motor switch protein FliN/FliY
MAEEGVKEDISADDWAAALAEQEAPPTPAAPAVQPASFQELTREPVVNAQPGNLELVLDIPVNLTVEMGRAKMVIRNLLQLTQGSIVELDGLAGEPMSIMVNGTLIAQGEVVVVNDKFGIRVTDIITPEERLRRLRR